MTIPFAKLGRIMASAILVGALTIPAYTAAGTQASRVMSGPKAPTAAAANARLPSQGWKQTNGITKKDLTKQDFSAIADANHPGSAMSVGKLMGVVQKRASFTEFNRDNAQDISQKAMLKLWQAAPLLAQDPPANPNAYVSQVVRAAAIDLYHESEAWKRQQTQNALAEKMRAIKKQPDVPVPVVGKPKFSFEFEREILEFPYVPPHRTLPAEAHTDSNDLELQASSLPEPQRVMEARELVEQAFSRLNSIERRIFLLSSQDFTHGEIASTLGLTPANVKKTIDRARARLDKAD